jgi:hypothetical protein
VSTSQHVFILGHLLSVLSEGSIFNVVFSAFVCHVCACGVNVCTNRNVVLYCNHVNLVHKAPIF